MKILAFIALPLFFFACANNTQENNASTKDVHEEVGHASHDEAIVLNQGEAWKVDDNMMVFLQKMDKEVEDFSGTSYNDYQVLAMTLTEDLDQLTSNCTMTGQAHDELHKWLVPFIGTVNDFAKAGDVAESAANFDVVKGAMEVFNQFFE